MSNEGIDYMLDANYAKRALLPNAESKTGASLNFGAFSCTDIHLISSEGASGLVYSALSTDYYGIPNAAPAHLIIKECYPLEVADALHRQDSSLVFNEDAPKSARNAFARQCKNYRQAFINHTTLYQSDAREYITVPSNVFETNGTAYIVSDINNGVSLDSAIKDMTLHDKVASLVSLCDALNYIHTQGYAYLDLKPANVLIIKNVGTNKGTSDVRLFDFDTLTSLQRLKEGMDSVPHSGNWSAYEQTHPAHIHEVSLRSDLYSVGALLFWLFMSRPPSSNEVIHACGEWQVEKLLETASIKDPDKQVAHSLLQILQHTLVVEPEKRYPDALTLKTALQNLADTLDYATQAELDALQNAKAKINAQLSEPAEHVKDPETTRTHKDTPAVTKTNHESSKDEKSLKQHTSRRKFIAIACAAALLVAGGIFAIVSLTQSKIPVIGEWHGIMYTSQNSETGETSWVQVGENQIAKATFYEDGKAFFYAGSDKAIIYDWYFRGYAETGEYGKLWYCDLCEVGTNTVVSYFNEVSKDASSSKNGQPRAVLSFPTELTEQDDSYNWLMLWEKNA